MALRLENTLLRFERRLPSTLTGSYDDKTSEKE